MESKRFVTFQDYISHYAIDMDYLKKGCDRPEDWDKDVLFVDKWDKFDIQYTNKMYRINRFPTLIQNWDKYNQAEIFYDTDKEIKEQQSYLELERKFLNVFRNLWTCSRTFVESSISYKDIFPEDIDQNKLKELQEKLFESIIEVSELKDLEFLLKLNLRDYISTCLCFVDLNLIIWPGDFACPTYLTDQSNRELLEKICNVEGVYLCPLSS
ncbi:hypothetical protein [Brevibacillus laterosporus]|uniref:Uncharacterized protein n=2 Tax=Brevibacillus laterosporus TaxID=1465 RepID=A0AAP3DHU1_BRELA|nr:hypothetical protein [Brevibacillus laterosporus]MCZ0808121.1 hypothetical protein [Brevibacillus laterosporus]MCZ0826313.1 hypothetical protein [Brevibacillus laterosporus]